MKNVFILCSGRTASTSFIAACKYITNYSAGHETLSRQIGNDLLNYPEYHIEADNRLSWFLGELDEKYGQDAFYVHLKRDEEKVAKSYNQRWHFRESIMSAFTNGILMRGFKGLSEEERLEICRFYVRTVNTNIEFFLKDKPQKMVIHAEQFELDFKNFWLRINAQGDLNKALEALFNKANSEVPPPSWKRKLSKWRHRLGI